MADHRGIRLTQYARGGGCACKIPPGELEEAVARLIPAQPGPDLLIGVEHGDDAAVVQISPDRAVVATATHATHGEVRQLAPVLAGMARPDATAPVALPDFGSSDGGRTDTEHLLKEAGVDGETITTWLSRRVVA